jgi:signal transduction histidine kinase
MRKLVVVALLAGLLPMLLGTLTWLTASRSLVPPDARPALALIVALAAHAAIVMLVFAAARRQGAVPLRGTRAESLSAAASHLLLRLGRAFSLERRDLRGAAVSRFLLYALPVQPRTAPLPLNDVVAVCVDAMLPTAGRRPAARVVFDPAPDAGHCALDPDLFHQVLLNLILNARDAAGASGLVSVRTQRIDDSVLLAVRDDGPGVPPAEMDAIFEPFRSAKPRALGIGLATCRLIVEAHGGTIDAMNILPRGLEVAIRLPRVAALALPDLSSARPAASRRA